MSEPHDESVAVFDTEGRPAGALPRAEAKRSGLAIGAVNVLLVNARGEVLLQRRPADREEIDEMMQCDPNLSKAETLRLFDFADQNHIVFRYAADLLGARVLKTEVVAISGIPIVEVKKTPLDGWGRIIKRFFDIIFGLIFVILFSINNNYQ